MISETILTRFKQYYKNDYGVDLTPEETLEKCTALFDMLESVYISRPSLTLEKKHEHDGIHL